MPIGKHSKEYETGTPATDRLIGELVANIAPGEHTDLVREIITSAVKLGKESGDAYDLNLANTALKELRYSFKVFSPYRSTRKVIIFGSARSKPTSPEYKMARSFAGKIGRKGYMVVTGGGPGVMEAGNRGAPEGSDFALNIRLPFEQKPNPFVSAEGRLINYKYFFTRKLFFVKETDATAVFPGGFGTLDEGFEMLTLVQTGKAKPRPIILMEPPGSTYWRDCVRFLERQLTTNEFVTRGDTDLFTIAKSPDEAVAAIETFYRMYHSMRYAGKQTILRLNRELSGTTLRKINKKFSDILIDGDIRPAPPAPEEMTNNEFPGLPRLTFNFNRRDFAGLHRLIMAINRDEN